MFLSGFEVNSSALYKAYNADCIQGAFVADQKVTAPTVSSEYLTKAAEMSKLVQRMYRNNQSINVKLFMKDSKDQMNVFLLDHFSERIGTQTTYLPTNKLAKGTYFVELELEDKKLIHEFVLDK